MSSLYIDENIKIGDSNISLKDLLDKVNNISELINNIKTLESNRNQSGYTYLPNGMILQWKTDFSAGITMREYSKTIPFPIPFPNNCLIVVACTNDPGWGIQGFNNAVGVTAYTKTSFTITIKKHDQYDSGIEQYIRMIAIGY